MTELSGVTVLDAMPVYASARKYGLMRIRFEDLVWSLVIN